ncbi:MULTISPECIES: putative glycolipid-binding domain-containing protein [Dietzia]|nr:MULTISPECIES: putative glycolipid-binding domain-containing protein [Dietzia]MCT1516227.1 putative glycolipid-binding domain-containing protein [Dietzia cercidiphylli]
MNASQSPSPQVEAPRASAPRMYTWISETGRVIEQVRLVRKGESSRARGRIVSAAHPDHQAFTLEYQVEIGSDLAPHRVQLTVSTEEYERTIDLVRDAEGSWLLDDPSDTRSRVGGDGVVDVDVTFSVFFASVISRRLGLHSQPGSIEQRVLSVDSLTLDVTEDSVTFSSDDEKVHGITATAATSATVDPDGFILDVTGLSRRV